MIKNQTRIVAIMKVKSQKSLVVIERYVEYYNSRNGASGNYPYYFSTKQEKALGQATRLQQLIEEKT